MASHSDFIVSFNIIIGFINIYEDCPWDHPHRRAQWHPYPHQSSSLPLVRLWSFSLFLEENSAWHWSHVKGPVHRPLWSWLFSFTSVLKVFPHRQVHGKIAGLFGQSFCLWLLNLSDLLKVLSHFSQINEGGLCLSFMCLVMLPCSIYFLHSGQREVFLGAANSTCSAVCSVAVEWSAGSISNQLLGTTGPLL